MPAFRHWLVAVTSVLPLAGAAVAGKGAHVAPAVPA